jgi:nitrite reductase/ring-hydroxylating ferredoxin subunit
LSEQWSVDADDTDALGAGEVRVVPLPRDELGRPREALLVRDAAGELRAYLNRCRHLAIPLDGGSRDFLTPDGQHLRCGTHGALYRLDDGYCVEGPCQGAALVALPFDVVDGVVRLRPPG